MTLFDPEGPPRRSRNRRRRRTTAALGATLSAALLIGVTIVGVWAIRNPQPILDQVAVWQYEPSAVISGHVERLQLTDHGEFLYYASDPVISTAAQFAKQCPIAEGDYGILGCYVPATKAIHLFDVTDERLDGTEEVTAAHEMLHAAWDRLSRDERDELIPLLEAEARKLATDPEFTSRMALYERVEPGQRNNELHSIIGTEIPVIGDKLEEYYSRYFVDRTVVTGLHEVANAVFVQLKARTQELVSGMDELRASIESDYASYTAGYDSLNADIFSFNAAADRGQFSSQQQFAREREALLGRKRALDATFESITDRQGQYEAMHAELESLNAVAAELQQGLNIGGQANSDL